MHRIALAYSLLPEGSSGDPPGGRDLHHPLLVLLDAIQASGSISAAARELSYSYRYVWGELRRWEAVLGQPLVCWAKGQRARLSPVGERLLRAERLARARLAPQIDALRAELERSLALALDESAGVLPVCAGHDELLLQLRRHAAERRLYLDLQFASGAAALAALNEGRCLLAGLHLLADMPPRSPQALACRALLDPARHRLVPLAQRTQGLLVAPGNPLGLRGLHDLLRPGVRFANRQPGTGTRMVLEELLAAQALDPAGIDGYGQPERSQQAVAEAVANGSADAAFGTQALAVRKGLDFIGLVREHCFLAGLADAFDERPVRQLLALLHKPAWLRELAGLPGHEPMAGDTLMPLAHALPAWREAPAAAAVRPRRSGSR